MGPMQPHVTPVAWTLVVPLKPLERAKSRLAGAAAGTPLPGLALAFAQDTVRAALASPAVRRVVVVTDDALAAGELTALGARAVPDAPGAGLNAALTHGARVARSGDPSAAVAALNADLPALRPDELERVLNRAARFPRAFLPDAAEIGTTFLSALPPVPLSPAFGGPSRARHRASGAVELDISEVPGMRQDVDTPDDLRTALALGVGAFTSALLAGPVPG
ncbi:MULTISPECIES: 2-phospho-L-lactate guanylyltransferase [unclassified Streptomyces]|uniref:2-phospho-L-lactate guanylyltransferase n=1 Tax=unclassified Streptomyces TaxID=2593676 RepID=UPI002DDA0B4A|nr:MULTISPECIES: 2-phospho-L-lactate guanylyltransferase [unclassified Streptomyces]WSA92135.1 2-phospho-L-lactate guanylyltransferase [Streptomyces sp. NBC_01795]WSB76500.1 2-phospho-L-lactate guanylyltransferase [Streptomyces sp. NBC_01775]WSS15211.1 2-phospho-L-lactate guanylyltransferase [Streptomyces sp. NBC_01186]WSS44053.1 2-phospho-L-lactate guanylyltransferase [Streptomyces sp. NBC_01187]